jgi:hypothetical protein
LAPGGSFRPIPYFTYDIAEYLLCCPREVPGQFPVDLPDDLENGFILVLVGDDGHIATIGF